MRPPLIAVEPLRHSREAWVTRAVESGGGIVVPAGDNSRAMGMVWLEPGDPAGLRETISSLPWLEWAHLPWAGIDGLIDGDTLTLGAIQWTCAKGVAADTVAEHALALVLAGLRRIPQQVRSRGWDTTPVRTLRDARVTVVGGGGVAGHLLSLLAPFGCDVTVVRRTAAPLAGARRTMGPDRLDHALAGAEVAVLALALTPETNGIVGPAELAALAPGACLVNVARGRHIRTPALVDVLESERLGAACLDVTDPEPLPPTHRLWELPNVLITAHTADAVSRTRRALAAQLRVNVQRFAAGLPLLGMVDAVAGY